MIIATCIYILGYMVFLIGGLCAGLLFFYGIYTTFVNDISQGLMLIGASVLGTFFVRLISALLMSIGTKIGTRKLVSNCEQSSAVNECLDDDLTKTVKADEHKEEATNDITPEFGKNQIQQGIKLADDCFCNGLQQGQIVKMSEIDSYIEANFSYMPNAVSNGFLTRMREYIDSGSVVNLSVESGEIVFVHSDHVDSILKDTPKEYE